MLSGDRFLDDLREISSTCEVLVPEEMPAGQPKRLISYTNHRLANSPEATLACFKFAEKAGLRWTGKFGSLPPLIRVRGWGARERPPSGAQIKIANIPDG